MQKDLKVVLSDLTTQFCSPELPSHTCARGHGFDTQSYVYKMLQDNMEPLSEPKQSGSFRYLQGILEAEESGKNLKKTSYFW